MTDFDEVALTRLKAAMLEYINATQDSSPLDVLGFDLVIEYLDEDCENSLQYVTDGTLSSRVGRLEYARQITIHPLHCHEPDD